MSHAAGNTIVAIACGAVAVVLLFGLVNMMRGGNPNLSQKLMRWRIGLQFVAIVIIMGVLFLRPTPVSHGRSQSNLHQDR